jgi:2-C-methyl-D-erythritol 4-phosphate cytidylyltransferase / 2-C-methyl-D-erythritol 2,4-cyclodiphosphate synthase
MERRPLSRARPVKTAALILAAGSGARAPGPVPKQYRPLGIGSALARSVEVMLAQPGVDLVQVVIAPDDRPLYDAALPGAAARLLPPVAGGATRQQSALEGLLALAAHAPDRVLIHDSARPFVTADIIARVLAALAHTPAAIAAVPVTDSLKRADAAGRIAQSIDRDRLWRAQTPQGFAFAAILAAHRAAAAAGLTGLSDDAAVAEWAGLPVALVAGSAHNRKLTTAEDLAMAAPQPLPDVRTGLGFDVHRLVAGDHVWLCGIRIPHTAALDGHSDADVALHALTDALLGAVGEADIGQLFPDSDPRWKGASSHLFVCEAVRRVRLGGGQVTNVDVTIVCEAPRIGPHRSTMRARIAELLEIEPERVAVKATTTETLGFTGRREGIAALATATVVRVPRPQS